MRTIPILAVITTAALFAPATAHADQCALIKKPVADQAVALVKQSATAVDFCEPCGDRAPGKPYTIATAEIRANQLFVNGAPVDLAYLYVETAPDEYRNVGLSTRCGASEVSEWIRGSKPSGPTPRRHVPRPPMPPPPRATSPDDLAGTWKVRTTTRFSSCTSVRPDAPAVETVWTIGHTGGVLAVSAADGLELAGSSALASPNMLKYTLQPRHRPSSGALLVSQFVKDRFGATLVRSEPVGKQSRDPVCVVLQDVWATRAP